MTRGDTFGAEPSASRLRTWRWVIATMAAGATALVASMWQSRPAGQLLAITGFGDNPTALAMHLYVPPRLPQRPAVLLALHWCTGSGTDFHRYSGFSEQADRHGFLVIYPSATRQGRCWDVHSPAALHHGGRSDPRGLLAMIQHVIETRQADASRVFVAGHSSGGMMTQVLLGAYPGTFRAGAAFAGVPFGCFAGPTEWHEDCARGRVTKSAAEWGSLVRAAHPQFRGTRPPLQLWHGTADDALDFHNFGEAVKQWTDVLELGIEPVATDTGIPAAAWTRYRHADAAGVVKLEAYRGDGEPHNFELPAAAVIRFFGLDQPGAETG